VNPASAAPNIVKSNRFPKTCSFSVQADRPFSQHDCLGAHVRIRGDPALLCFGAELEICPEHAADCFGKVVACSLSRAASLCILDVEVFRHVVYLPCSPQLLHANLTEVFHIFIEKMTRQKAPNSWPKSLAEPPLLPPTTTRRSELSLPSPQRKSARNILRQSASASQ
jgi:hypothetical protein